jgi:preprotein translocase subunit Sec61beta
MILLVGWLLTLFTVVRTRAINTLLASDVPRVLVNAGKALGIIVMIALFAVSVALAWRRLFVEVPTSEVVAAGLAVGLVVAAANFVLFYAYIAALTSPNASGGVILVFMIMAWVNAVSRILLLSGCWIAVGRAAEAPR